MARSGVVKTRNVVKDGQKYDYGFDLTFRKGVQEGQQAKKQKISFPRSF